MSVAVHQHPAHWIEQVFSAKAVEKGGVIRRSVAWVDHEIGRDRLADEVRQRGFHLLEAGGQFIVVCTRGPISWIV
ncbi:MAG: N-(5'-phosphoribosyl)anthranilate isomerase [Rhodobacteraceae bacterium]|nr:N-(5'-phosphoribosyl)anthranilate isomerase [Paracoccaceae bacterium]